MPATRPNAATLPDATPLLVGVIAAQVIGGLITQMSPFVIDGLMRGFSLSERDAGFVGSIEFFTLAASAIAIAPALPRVSSRRLAFIALALALLSDGASIFSPSAVWFAVLRGIAGIGEGTLYALSLCVVASRCSNPDRVYGYFQIVWALGSVALYLPGGELTAAFALRGILVLIGIVTLLLAPLLIFLPDNQQSPVEAPGPGRSQTSPLLGSLTLLAIVLYLSVSDAVYAFSAPLGQRAGLNTVSVGYALTVGTLVGLVGAGAATAINVRWGRAVPISVSCIAFSLIAVVLCLWNNSTAYVIALAASFIIYYFSIPFLFGLAAALDPQGRWAAASGSAYLLGFAAGPPAAGVVIGSGGYTHLAIVSVATTIAVWALALVVNYRLTARQWVAEARR